MPFRASFACLWCGRDHVTRSPDDLEGWASLCPECIGRADANGFLRTRVRTALRERSEGARTSTRVAASALAAPNARTPATASGPAAASPAHDEWYLRGGRFSRGPLTDQPWLMELDEATRWLDEAPIRGEIVELGAGSGWWSTLLAGKGELWVYDQDEGSLESARRRLVAHGLRAHLHLRDPIAAADRPVDTVVSAYLLGGAPDERDLRRRLEVVRDWLRPAGTFAFIEARPGAGSEDAPIEGPAGPLWPREPHELRTALTDVGLEPIELRTNQRSFVLGLARRAG